MSGASAHPPERDRVREPIHKPGLWIGVALIVAAGVPLYLPAGDIDPILLGIPYWLLISVVAALALSAFLCVACLRWWSLAEPQESAERQDGAEG